MRREDKILGYVFLVVLVLFLVVVVIDSTYYWLRIRPALLVAEQYALSSDAPPAIPNFFDFYNKSWVVGFFYPLTLLPAIILGVFVSMRLIKLHRKHYLAYGFLFLLLITPPVAYFGDFGIIDYLRSDIGRFIYQLLVVVLGISVAIPLVWY